MKEIPLGGKKGKDKYALVDDEDYELVSRFKWHLHSPRHLEYARASLNKGVNVLMHRLLLPGYPLIDHKDGNGLNNQRYNIRPATRAQNNRNRRKVNPGSSKFKGVCWSKTFNCWVVNIKLGDFQDEIEAARAYDQAAVKLFGEFASINGV